MSTIIGALRPAVSTSGATSHWAWNRFAIAFGAAFLVTSAVVLAAICAYDLAFDGRVVPGVHAGGVDLSGLDRARAVDSVRAAYASYGDGYVIVRTAAADMAIAHHEFARRVDAESMVDAAMAVARTGTPLERAVTEVRSVLQGAKVDPRIAFDAHALAGRIDRALSALELAPVSATISMAPTGLVTTPARLGRTYDRSAIRAAALGAVGDPLAPAEIVVEAEAIDVLPAIPDDVVRQARTAATRMMADLTITDGTRTWTIASSTVGGWLSFRANRDDDTIDPVADRAAIAAALAGVAKDVELAPVSATYLTGKSGGIVGVAASRDGRTLDVDATVSAISKALASRSAGTAPAALPAVIATVRPRLTTEQAAKVAPLMVRLGTWTTWFPIGERNANGANIWLPAQYINGTVLAPGQTFEWFSAVGPITRARGFGSGGIIDGDHTDPTGALGGGMCSSSTTLFNAALRAGLQMGARANHIYYIDRYPLGLDATVWAIGGARQTVTFTNDMEYPILIKGIKIRDGAKGYVRYEIWGVPDGRTVSLSTPLVKNVVKAVTRTVPVTTLPPGVRKQTEYPVNGMDVWVTRTVRSASGAVIHRETYYSHYALWNGRIEVGVAA